MRFANRSGDARRYFGWQFATQALGKFHFETLVPSWHQPTRLYDDPGVDTVSYRTPNDSRAALQSVGKFPLLMPLAHSRVGSKLPHTRRPIRPFRRARWNTPCLYLLHGDSRKIFDSLASGNSPNLRPRRRT